MDTLSFSANTAAAAGVAALVLVYSVYSVIYNLYFHPLARFPGPFFLRATRIAYLWRTYRGRLPFDILPMHNLYGPVVRIAPDQLSFIDIAAWRDIYGRRNDLENPADELPKDERFYHMSGVDASILSETRENHAVLRRQLVPGFSDRAMRDQSDMISKYVELMVSSLRERALHKNGKEVQDMLCWYSWTTFDIIGDLAFGEPFGYLKNASDTQPWIDSLSALYLSNFVLICRLAGITGYIFPILKNFSPALAASGRLGVDKIRRRMALTEKRPDLIQGLVERKKSLEEGESDCDLSLDKLSTTAGILVLAGSETTTKLLTGATYLLLSHPECFKKAVAEVRSAFATAKDLTLNSATPTKLPYLMACVKESLRRFPPVMIGLPRVTPKGGATIAGEFVPENTTVSSWQYAMNHAAQYWHEPELFKPERFLGEGNDNLEAMQPFVVGPRNCIGRALAYSESRLLLAQLLYNFDVELADPSIDWMKQKAYAVWDAPPLRVRLTPV